MNRHARPLKGVIVVRRDEIDHLLGENVEIADTDPNVKDRASRVDCKITPPKISIIATCSAPPSYWWTVHRVDWKPAKIIAYWATPACHICGEIDYRAKTPQRRRAA